MINRRLFLQTTGLATAAMIINSRGAAQQAKNKTPNFLWILSEDNSKHYLKLFDDMGAPTPAIENMAKYGVIFDRAFSNAPVCSVARTTLMTGCYAPRTGTQYHRRQAFAKLPDGLRLFPAYLRDVGYYTTNNSKKDYNCVESKDVWDESSRKATWRKRPSTETPFFHMESTGVSHEGRLHFKDPEKTRAALTTDPTKVKLAPYHPDTTLFRTTYAHYHDCITRADDYVKMLIGKLEEDNLLEDTFVFYFGDHGGVLPGSKGYIHESGLHVPLVVRIPENYKHLVALKPGTRNTGFVSFIDFGATLLNLAGVDKPSGIDGKPFLGPAVSAAQLAARDETFGYADRFDEKYDQCRSLRKGRYKYIRNYQAFYPDALQNNYRYRQLAYEEWRSMYKAGKLNAVQRAFFEAKPVEQLFDLQKDPHQAINLANNKKHAAKLIELRGKLQKRVKEMPDLSFYPESHLIDAALPEATAFGQKNKARIAHLIDIADLSLLPFSAAKEQLQWALASTDPWRRYWALIACSCFADRAKSLIATVKDRLEDDTPLVRVRAAEFLAIVQAQDPRPTLYDVLNKTEKPHEALLIFNTVVFINDHLKNYPFDLSKLKMKIKRGETIRRLDYLKQKG